MANIIDQVINGGVNYIVALGSTGETATLNEAEARDILDFCIKHINNRVPLVAGNFGGNDTKELVKKIKDYNFDGVAAILSSSPAYIKPSQEGIYRHYTALAEVSPVPIIIYNVPGRTRSNIEWENTVRLAEASKNFVGIKEASGDLIQTTRIIKNKPDHFIVTSGDDEVALAMTAVGGDGVPRCWPVARTEGQSAALVRKSAAALAPMMKGVTATMARSPVAQFKSQTRGAIGRGRRLVIA